MRVEVEMPVYKTEAVEEVAVSIVYNYIRFSGIEGVKSWSHYLENFRARIKNHIPQGLKLVAPGIDFWFSGLNSDTRIDSGKLVFEDPWFRAFANRQLISPRERTNIDRVSFAIFREASEVFPIQRPEPYTLILPKEIFVKDYQPSKAALV